MNICLLPLHLGWGWKYKCLCPDLFMTIFTLVTYQMLCEKYKTKLVCLVLVAWFFSPSFLFRCAWKQSTMDVQKYREVFFTFWFQLQMCFSQLTWLEDIFFFLSVCVEWTWIAVFFHTLIVCISKLESKMFQMIFLYLVSLQFIWHMTALDLFFPFRSSAFLFHLDRVYTYNTFLWFIDFSSLHFSIFLTV